MASTPATARATTSRAGLRVGTATGYRALKLDGRGLLARRDAIAVIDTKAAGRVLGERVAVALPVRGPHEGGDQVERPFADPCGLAPEIGQAKVDIEFEQIDTRWVLGHAIRVGARSDGLALAVPMRQNLHYGPSIDGAVNVPQAVVDA